MDKNKAKALPPIIPPLPQTSKAWRPIIEEAMKRDPEMARGVLRSNLDIDVRDARIDSEVIGGVFTRYHVEGRGWLFIWLDTGYMVRIRIKALQPIVDELVSKEVLNRLKGKEKEDA